MTKIPYLQKNSLEAVTRRCSVKKAYYTFTRGSFLIKLQVSAYNFIQRQVFSRKFWKLLRNLFLCNTFSGRFWRSSFNDTHREKLFYSIQYKNG